VVSIHRKQTYMYDVSNTSMFLINELRLMLNKSRFQHE